MASKTLKITLVRSTIGTPARHRECIKCLGFKRMHQTLEVSDTPSNRGLINKVQYMLAVEN